MGWLNGWYIEEWNYPYEYPVLKGPSCYIIFFGASDGEGYDVHIQTQPGERPDKVLTFPAYFDPETNVYEPASFKYRMTIDFEKGTIYLWVKHSETGMVGEVTYSFDEFGWQPFWFSPAQDPMDLAGNPVFAGVISENNAGHASISAIKITER